MNEQIREVWIKAAREDSDPNWDTQEQFIERFAQLIVRECAGIGYDASYYECALNVSNKIKEHFGVEE